MKLTGTSHVVSVDDIHPNPGKEMVFTDTDDKKPGFGVVGADGSLLTRKNIGVNNQLVREDLISGYGCPGVATVVDHDFDGDGFNAQMLVIPLIPPFF